MRRNRIVKIVMSAAAAAYVAVMPVQAEETDEEVIMREWEDSHSDPRPDEGSQMTEGNGENNGTVSSGTEYHNAEDETTDTESTANKNAADANEPDKNMADASGPQENAVNENIANERVPEAEGSREEIGVPEAEYSAMGQVSGGELEENAEKDPELEELIRKTGYGPHLMALKKKEEEKEEAGPEPAQPAYTEEDLYILAHAICGEGQGYPDDEQLYIGSVILNRRAHGAFPDTIKGVVFQRGQYACTRDGNYYREPTEANWRNARWLLENGSILPGNVVYQARFRQGSGLYAQTRYHKYCYR